MEIFRIRNPLQMFGFKLASISQSVHSELHNVICMDIDKHTHQ